MLLNFKVFYTFLLLYLFIIIIMKFIWIYILIIFEITSIYLFILINRSIVERMINIHITINSHEIIVLSLHHLIFIVLIYFIYILLIILSRPESQIHDRHIGKVPLQGSIPMWTQTYTQINPNSIRVQRSIYNKINFII